MVKINKKKKTKKNKNKSKYYKKRKLSKKYGGSAAAQMDIDPPSPSDSQSLRPECLNRTIKIVIKCHGVEFFQNERSQWFSGNPRNNYFNPGFKLKEDGTEKIVYSAEPGCIDVSSAQINQDHPLHSSQFVNNLKRLNELHNSGQAISQQLEGRQVETANSQAKKDNRVIEDYILKFDDIRVGNKLLRQNGAAVDGIYELLEVDDPQTLDRLINIAEPILGRNIKWDNYYYTPGRTQKRHATIATKLEKTANKELSNQIGSASIRLSELINNLRMAYGPDKCFVYMIFMCRAAPLGHPRHLTVLQQKLKKQDIGNMTEWHPRYNDTVTHQVGDEAWLGDNSMDIKDDELENLREVPALGPYATNIYHWIDFFKNDDRPKPNRQQLIKIANYLVKIRPPQTGDLSQAEAPSEYIDLNVYNELRDKFAEIYKNKGTPDEEVDSILRDLETPGF